MLRFQTTLRTELRRIRRRLQMERLLKGIGLVCVFVLAASLLSSYILSSSNFSDSTILWTRIAVGLALLALIFKGVLIPIFRRPSSRRVARFLEERYPRLRERLSTAVEVTKTPGRVHPTIRRLIQNDALQKLRGIEMPRLFYPRTSLWSLLAAVATSVIFSSLFFGGPEVFRYSLDKLLRGWYLDDQTSLYSISVSPGDARVVRHADVEIRASLAGFTSENVKIVAKYENLPNWEEAGMRPDPNGNEFVFLFFDARDRIDYYVESDGIQSDRYTITVSDVPAVEKLEVTLNFPRHTGLEAEVKEDDGDIRALTGTVADFSIRTDQDVAAGAIKLEEGGDLALERVSPRELKGRLKITRDDFYRIHLQNQEGVWNPSSDEYIIEALIDQPPSVSFTRPGRDQKVTNLEEVFTEVKVSDDYGIRQVTLHYSVNGEPDQKIDLDTAGNAQNLTTSHTFYLEEYDLQPGDFVAYFAEAADAVSSSRTDIFFLEVQPYDREYFQSQQAGGGAAGGGPDQLFLSKLQKEIISATFNVVREKTTYSQDEFEENVQTVALMQQQLQQQAQTIVERIERRGGLPQIPLFHNVVEHLKEAAVHMGEAHQKLNQLQPGEALPPEQKALQQLLRAESFFKQIQMSMGSSEGGGGGASAEDLADLVDLELDKKKNQYETLQQNRQQGRDQALDDMAQKLKDLARRQEQEVERRRRQAQQSSSGGGGSSQQELLDEVEKLARQLERLSRQERDQQLNEISRKLNQAARDLRQSQSGGNPQEAQMRAQRALERLQEAQEALNRQRDSQMSGSIERLAQESQQLQQRQEEVLEGIRSLESRQRQDQIDEKWMQEHGRILREKRDLQEDLQRLETDLHQTARRLSSQQPSASRKLKQAGIEVRDQRLPEKMQEGTELMRRGWTALAQRREESVAEGLRELTERIEEAQAALGSSDQTTPEERAEKALNQIGNLVEDLESLRERASRQQGQESGQEQPSEQGQSSNQGQPSEQGRPSQQAGQQEGRAQQGQQPGQQAGRQGEQESESDSSQRGGNRSEMGDSPRSTPLGGSLANSRGIDPQQISREWRERIQDAESLRDLLRTIDPGRARDVNALARRMRQLDAQRIFDDPEEIARLKSQIIDGFRELELQLYQGLKPTPEQLRLAHEDEVPPQFRNRVEEYYRALASERRKP